jgi:ankyrin repeat protein
MLEATENGDLAEVKRLLSATPKAEQDELLNKLLPQPLLGPAVSRGTPLTVAASRGYGAIVQCLVDNGAKLDAQDTEGKTALYHALAERHIPISQFLIGKMIEHGKSEILTAADLRNVLTDMCEGRTVLMLAIETGNFDLIKKLIEAAELFGINLLENTWKQHGYDENPLIQAVGTGNLDIVTYLIEKKADPNEPNSDYTPLSKAVAMGNMKIIKYLIETCNVDVDGVSGAGSPLILAVKANNPGIIKYLLTHKANPVQSDGTSVFMVPIDKENLSMAKMLVDLGVQPTDKDIGAATARATWNPDYKKFVSLLKKAQHKKAPAKKD